MTEKIQLSPKEPWVEPTKSSNASLGQTWVYFLSPWGMQFELCTYPDGKAYEKDAKVKLWHPAHPAE